MTPFGERLIELRRMRGVTQKEMAAELGVSAAYLSALEHGRRGTPTWFMVQKIIGYFNIIWDEAEELQRLAASSQPRVVIDTGGLPPAATAFANRLRDAMPRLSAADLELLDGQLKKLVDRLD